MVFDPEKLRKTGTDLFFSCWPSRLSINLLPFLKLRQEVLKITAFNEHRLAVMFALDADINRSTVKVGRAEKIDLSRFYVPVLNDATKTALSTF